MEIMLSPSVSQESLSKYESGSFLWHWHPEIELTYITRGEMTYKVNHNTYHLHPKDALFGNTGTLHMAAGMKIRTANILHYL